MEGFFGLGLVNVRVNWSNVKKCQLRNSIKKTPIIQALGRQPSARMAGNPQSTTLLISLSYLLSGPLTPAESLSTGAKMATKEP